MTSSPARIDGPEPDRMTGLVLETSAACQLQCSLCFLRSYTERPEPNVMPVEVVDAVLPHLDGLSSVDLTGWGEPLMNPRFFEIVARIRERFSGRLSMTTNGLLLKPESMQQLVDLGIDVVCVSVDAATDGTYRKLRKPGDFMRLRRALEDLVETRARGGSGKPLLFGTFLLRRGALGELSDFVGLAAGHGLDGVVFQMLTGVFSEEGLSEVTHCDYYGNDFECSRLEEVLENARATAPPGFIIAGPETIGPVRRGGCGGFDITRPFITSAGLVSVCCAMAYPCALVRRDGKLEKTAATVFGDVLTTALPEIWQDPYYVRTRAEIREGRVPEACGDCIALYMKPGEAWTAP